jgi:hypothetical protein
MKTCKTIPRSAVDVDPEAAKYLQEENTIVPGMELLDDDRREEPCWTRYADFFPLGGLETPRIEEISTS